MTMPALTAIDCGPSSVIRCTVVFPSTICTISSPFGWRSHALSPENLAAKMPPSRYCDNFANAPSRSASAVSGVRPRSVFSSPSAAFRSITVITVSSVSRTAAVPAALFYEETGGRDARVPLSSDVVERPDRAAHLVKEFRRVDLGAQGAGIDEDDLARDRLEGGAEMLHRLDRDGAVARRVEAQRGELPEIDRLAVIGDDDDVDAADPEHHRRPVIAFDPAAHRAMRDKPAGA